MCAVIAEKMEFFGKNHVMIPWHDSVRDESVPIKKASIKDRATLIGRAGMIELSCGTGAWRVRDSMNILGRVIGVAVTADVGLTSINFSVSDNDRPSTGAMSVRVSPPGWPAAHLHFFWEAG